MGGEIWLAADVDVDAGNLLGVKPNDDGLDE